MSSKLVIRAARGESVERTPIWMMRQAGRYLTEYHSVKEKAGGFLGLCKIPEYSIEVALQPIRRFGFDAAILFSDILIPAEAMGFELDFNPGPIIGNPVRTDADLARIRVADPEESLGFVTDILKGLGDELPRDTTLIGFAGAPYTVASYVTETEASKNGFSAIRRLAYQNPSLVQALISRITETTIRYLKAQVAAGAEMLQLFDSSAGNLPPELYGKLALDPAYQIIRDLAGTGIPIVYFAPGAMACLNLMVDLGADVIGLDWRIPLAAARETLGQGIAVQGNLDPASLLGTEESIRDGVRLVLMANGGRPGHIFNLGHGVHPETPPSNVAVLVEALRSFGA